MLTTTPQISSPSLNCSPMHASSCETWDVRCYNPSWRRLNLMLEQSGRKAQQEILRDPKQYR